MEERFLLPVEMTAKENRAVSHSDFRALARRVRHDGKWALTKKMGAVPPIFLSPDARLELVLGPASQIIDLTPLSFEFLLVRVDRSILLISCIVPAL